MRAVLFDLGNTQGVVLHGGELVGYRKPRPAPFERA